MDKKKRKEKTRRRARSETPLWKYYTNINSAPRDVNFMFFMFKTEVHYTIPTVDIFDCKHRYYNRNNIV